MWKCPNCEAEIDHLKYDVATISSEYGTADLDDKKQILNGNKIIDYSSEDQGDTDWDESPNYRCPECDNDITLGEIEWIDTEEQPKEEIKLPPPPPEPEETLHTIIKPGIIFETEQSWNDDQTRTIMICKSCFHTFMYQLNHKNNTQPENESYECPKCGETMTSKEYFELLQKGFFNQKRKIINLKQPDVKKNTSRLITSLVKSRASIHSKISGSKRIQKTKTGRTN